MFLSTKEIIIKKIKELLGYLAFGIIFAGFFLLMFAMEANDELRIGIRNDILTFGLVAFVARVYYVWAINRYRDEQQKRQARRQQRKASSSKRISTPAPVAPIFSVPAPVAKPVFFDFEAHE